MPFTKTQIKQLTTLGKRVKSIRTEKELTLKELAYTIGKDPQSIHRLEMGGVNPSYLYLLDICKGLEIDITDLLNGLND
ncbi:helix-turn-helix domain-containing protein [Chitinophagaceae bacterium LWZ2-11]